MSKRKNKRNKQDIKRDLKKPVGKRFVIRDYIIMNLVVFAFISVAALSFCISAGFKVDGLQAGIFRFIFLYAFGCVFFAVSMIDYIIGRHKSSALDYTD